VSALRSEERSIVLYMLAYVRRNAKRSG